MKTILWLYRQGAGESIMDVPYDGIVEEIGMHFQVVNCNAGCTAYALLTQVPTGSFGPQPLTGDLAYATVAASAATPAASVFTITRPFYRVTRGQKLRCGCSSTNGSPTFAVSILLASLDDIPPPPPKSLISKLDFVPRGIDKLPETRVIKAGSAQKLAMKSYLDTMTPLWSLNWSDFFSLPTIKSIALKFGVVGLILDLFDAAKGLDAFAHALVENLSTGMLRQRPDRRAYVCGMRVRIHPMAEVRVVASGNGQVLIQTCGFGLPDPPDECFDVLTVEAFKEKYS